MSLQTVLFHFTFDTEQREREIWNMFNILISALCKDNINDNKKQCELNVCYHRM